MNIQGPPGFCRLREIAQKRKKSPLSTPPSQNDRRTLNPRFPAFCFLMRA